MTHIITQWAHTTWRAAWDRTIRRFFYDYDHALKTSLLPCLKKHAHNKLLNTSCPNYALQDERLLPYLKKHSQQAADTAFYLTSVEYVHAFKSIHNHKLLNTSSNLS